MQYNQHPKSNQIEKKNNNPFGDNKFFVRSEDKFYIEKKKHQIQRHTVL